MLNHFEIMSFRTLPQPNRAVFGMSGTGQLFQMLKKLLSIRHLGTIQRPIWGCFCKESFSHHKQRTGSHRCLGFFCFFFFFFFLSDPQVAPGLRIKDWECSDSRYNTSLKSVTQTNTVFDGKMLHAFNDYKYFFPCQTSSFLASPLKHPTALNLSNCPPAKEHFELDEQVLLSIHDPTV